MSHPHDSIPPGLNGDLTHVVSGGTTSEWQPFTITKNFTNAFIIKDGKILLGFKKRGFGQDLYNGFGGKVEPEETFQQAAVRELQEEAGITAPLEYAGTLFFTTDGANDFAFIIEVYRADEYTGTVTETDEMRPEWFSLPSTDSQASDTADNLSPIPYHKMWADDIHWFPLMLSNTKFAGRADFKREGDGFVMEKWWFGTLRT